jgi:pimeloyl-ACP methyl ester carboxylesterase/class 3 adenylate cyclase
MGPSETRYARSGDISIAYRVLGAGPVDLVLVPGIVSHVEYTYEALPGYAAFLDGLASFARVITFDKRGNGLSDRVPAGPGLEERMDDLRAVMDATGSIKAAVLGLSEGASLAIMFAATYPRRVSALVLFGGFARFMAAPDYPIGISAEQLAWLRGPFTDGWGRGVAVDLFGPSAASDEAARAAVAKLERLSATPSTIQALWDMNASIDVRAVLPSIRVPTLVLHRRRDRAVTVKAGRYLAERIPGARLVELDGIDHVPWLGDPGAVVAEVGEFLTGQRPGEPEAERQLLTVLFVDIVDSTRRAAELGDHAWRQLRDRFEAAARQALTQSRGRLVETAGDGLLAAFDGPARAVRGAVAIRDAARALALEVRAGLHTGEVEPRGDGLVGIAVHIAARIQALAAPGEVLVSSTVRDLVAGSGLIFVDRGLHALKGVPGEWRLLALSP